jgi:hypothetical protein
VRYLVDAVLLRERNTDVLLAGNTALGVLEAASTSASASCSTAR